MDENSTHTIYIILGPNSPVGDVAREWVTQLWCFIKK